MINGPEFLSGGKVKNLVVLLHGWGASGTNLIYLAHQMGKVLIDTKFVAPNAHIKCGDDGYQWFELDDRSEEILWQKIQLASSVVNSFIDKKLEELNLNDSNLILVGFSQGAMLSIHVSLCRFHSCAAVVAYSGAVVSPLQLQRKINSRPPICVVHGTQDNIVPFSSFGNTVDFLQKNNIAVDSHPIAGLNHSINETGIKIGAEFIQKNLLAY